MLNATVSRIDQPDMTLDEILGEVEETQVKADLAALKSQAQGAITQLKAVVGQLNNSKATKAAQQLRAAIIAELKAAFAG